jgi:hypothetical protein
VKPERQLNTAANRSEYAARQLQFVYDVMIELTLPSFSQRATHTIVFDAHQSHVIQSWLPIIEVTIVYLKHEFA